MTAFVPRANHNSSLYISHMSWLGLMSAGKCVFQVTVHFIPVGSMFPNLSSMVQALRDGNISSALFEMYVPVKRKDLFNGSWFEVSDVLEGEIQHGVLLQGEGVKLASEMKTLTLKNNIQTTYLQDGQVESSEVRFFKL